MNLNQENIEEWILLYVDRELNAKEEAEFLAYLKDHPKFQSLLVEYQATRLIPEKIFYPEKNNLLRPEIQRKPLTLSWKTAGMAASLALLLGIGIGYLMRSPLPSNLPLSTKQIVVSPQMPTAPDSSVRTNLTQNSKEQTNLAPDQHNDHAQGASLIPQKAIPTGVSPSAHESERKQVVLSVLPLGKIQKAIPVLENQRGIVPLITQTELPTLVLRNPDEESLMAKLNGDDPEDSKWPEASGIIEQFSRAKRHAKFNFLSLKKTTFVLLIGNKEIPIIK